MPESPQLKVLHVITRLIVGGAQENTVLTVIGQQNTPGMEVVLLSGPAEGREGDLYDQAHDAGIDLQLMPELVRPIDPMRDAVAMAKLVQFIRRGQFDVVHTHSSKAGILGRLAARAASTPMIVHTLHSLVFGDHASARQNALYLGMKRLCAPITDRFISVCDATKEGAIAAGVGRPEQHCTIYSGFPLEPFLSVRNELSVGEAKRRLGLDPASLVVGKVARLSPQKGHDYFLKAASLIARSEPRAKFLLVGDGTLRAELEVLARRLGIADRTVFAGLVAPDLVPGYMQAMDVVVHTSVREGLPRVLPQASAVGKPVVGFALDGTPEAIDDGVNGLLAEPYSVDDVARKVLSILPNEDSRRAMGNAGRRFAAARFSVEVMVERIDSVYRELALVHSRGDRRPHRAATMATSGAPSIGGPTSRHGLM